MTLDCRTPVVVGVGQVTDECEVNIAVVVPQEANLQVFDQAAHLLLAKKEGWDCDQRHTIIRNSSRVVQLR